MQSVSGSKPRAVAEDQFGRKPFVHPALDGLHNLSTKAKEDYISKMKLSMLARRYGLQHVVRWSPRKVDLSPLPR